MNRRTFLLGAGMASLAGCARDKRPRLNVYNWSAYVAPDTISSFENEFGVQVRYATYESNEEMLAKVLTGNSGWDVVFPTYNRVQPMRDYGLLEPLRHEWLPGLANLDPRFRAPEWDPELRWAMPYMWFATGIVYNRRLQPAPSGWADLWDPAQQAIDAAPTLAFVYPAEGFPFYCDCAVILRESSRSRLAHQFLDYLLRPKVSAAIADFTRTATANGAAHELLPPATRNNPTLYPTQDIYRKGEWPRTLPPSAQRLRDRIWTEIKSA
jgi:spermidine/putrescine-binding protein